MNRTSKARGRATLTGLLLGILGLLGTTSTHAEIQSGQWRFFNQLTPDSPAINFRVIVEQIPRTPDLDDPTGGFLYYDAAKQQLTGVTYNLDEGADFFVVQPGTYFTEAWGDAHTTALLIGPTGSHLSSFQRKPIRVGKDFYLGVRTRVGTFDGFTVFGWAHFKMDAQGQIQMVDNAMTFDEPGIVIGQTKSTTMVNGLLTFNATASSFTLCNHVDKDQPAADPYNCFTHSYEKSKALSSLLRFERTLKPMSANLAFDNRMYLVRQGDVITSDRLIKGYYPVLNNTGAGAARRASVNVGRDFWVALAAKTPAPQAASLTDPFNVLSWAHIRFNAQGVPEMLDHVTAHEGLGIVVGQKTPCLAQACLDAAIP